MKIPTAIPYLASRIGKDSKDFAAGWANGLARWRSWRGGHASPHRAEWDFPANPFDTGTVAMAASEAAVAYMRGRAARP